MNTSYTTTYRAASPYADVLTCAHHPTIIRDHKCWRCQKIVCSQCYNPLDPHRGYCTQCAENPHLCCVIL